MKYFDNFSNYNLTLTDLCNKIKLIGQNIIGLMQY